MFDGSNWTTYTEEDGLVSNNITSIIVDKTDNIWVGTVGRGISKYEKLD